MSSADDWMPRAACVDEDPELFFPVGQGAAAQAQTEVARAFCGRCEVRLPCARFALTLGDPFGVWGGLDPLERTRIRRRKPR